MSASHSYELYLSYTPARQQPALRLAEALRALGVAFACAPVGGDAALPSDLIRAKALLAWGSEDYFHARAAQAQLAAAAIAQRGEAAPRLLLVNAEAGMKHIYPVALREARFADAPGLPDAPDYAALAERLRDHCAGLDGALGMLCPVALPPWRSAYGSLAVPAYGFLRRERELWDIHALLCPEQPLPCDSEYGTAVAVAAIEGQGKTWLAREYAHRFAPAFPGGIFWLTAREARPAASLVELDENPALKTQLLSFLGALSSEDRPPLAADVPALRERLGERLKRDGQPFLWVVDDLPDELNGPAFLQWLAPAGAFGRTLITTLCHRDDERVECIHLPPLAAETAWRLLTSSLPPTSGAERAATARLLDALGRHAFAISAANAAARGDRRHRGAPYSALRKRLSDPAYGGAIVAAHLGSGLPRPQETALAGALLGAMSALNDAGRDILRLAVCLADAPLPVEFIVACFIDSGLCAEPPPRHWPEAWWRAMLRPRRPTEAETARRYIESGIAVLERLGLGELIENCLYMHHLAVHAMLIANHDVKKLGILRQSAINVLHQLAQSCADGCDWRPMSALDSHARMLTADPRELGAKETPVDLACRASLASKLGDMDLAHGAKQRALEAYRHAGAGLARAVAADAEAWDSLSELARTRERIGDILAARGDTQGALDVYLKSLRIVKRLTGQDPSRADWLRTLWNLYLKAGEVLGLNGDLDKARNSYRAALTLRAALPSESLADGGREFDLAEGFARLAALYRSAGKRDAALDALNPALEICQALAGLHPGHAKFKSALAGACSQVADVLWERGEVLGALEHYRRSIDEYAQLAGREPDNLGWKRLLAAIHQRVGSLLETQADAAGAMAHYLARNTLLKRLLPKGGADAPLQREMAVNYAKLGALAEHTGDASSALSYFRKALACVERWEGILPEENALREELAWVEIRAAELAGT